MTGLQGKRNAAVELTADMTKQRHISVKVVYIGIFIDSLLINAGAMLWPLELHPAVPPASSIVLCVFPLSFITV